MILRPLGQEGKFQRDNSTGGQKPVLIPRHAKKYITWDAALDKGFTGAENACRARENFVMTPGQGLLLSRWEIDLLVPAAEH